MKKRGGGERQTKEEEGRRNAGTLETRVMARGKSEGAREEERKREGRCAVLRRKNNEERLGCRIERGIRRERRIIESSLEGNAMEKG